METQNKVQKSWRTREQKEEFILLWKQSGKSRKSFCQEHGLNYNSFVTWHKQGKEKNKPSGFSEVKLEKDSSLFAQVHLPGGIKIDFYQTLPADYFQSLIRK